LLERDGHAHAKHNNGCMLLERDGHAHAKHNNGKETNRTHSYK
jgi:hypothetical protein